MSGYTFLFESGYTRLFIHSNLFVLMHWMHPWLWYLFCQHHHQSDWKREVLLTYCRGKSFSQRRLRQFRIVRS